MYFLNESVILTGSPVVAVAVSSVAPAAFSE